jgi:hypothetical protein
MDARSQKAVRRAERNARYRARLRAGEVCALVPVNASIVDFLVQTRWLADRDALDAAKIGDAIKLCLQVAAKAAL